MKTPKSPTRIFLRILKGMLGVPVLAMGFTGVISLWTAFGIYAIITVVFMAIDAPIAYREYKAGRQ